MGDCFLTRYSWLCVESEYDGKVIIARSLQSVTIHSCVFYTRGDVVMFIVNG